MDLVGALVVPPLGARRPARMLRVVVLPGGQG